MKNFSIDFVAVLLVFLMSVWGMAWYQYAKFNEIYGILNTVQEELLIVKKDAKRTKEWYRERLQELDMSKMKLYQNDEFRFRMMVPRDWQWDGVDFFQIVNNGEREKLFSLTIFRNPNDWGIIKADALIAWGSYSEDDFEDERYVGDMGDAPERFFYERCLDEKQCINPFIYHPSIAGNVLLVKVDNLLIEFFGSKNDYLFEVISQTMHTF